jgi:hypothetical protein
MFFIPNFYRTFAHNFFFFFSLAAPVFDGEQTAIESYDGGEWANIKNCKTLFARRDIMIERKLFLSALL